MKSKTFLLIISILLLSNASSKAEVNIPIECRVSNLPGGYCVYASLETIGRLYKIKNLYGLVDWYSQWRSLGAGSKEVKSCLDALGVKYQIYENASFKWLREQVDGGNPIMVGCWWVKEQHAIVIVDVLDTHVKYIDSNDTSKYHWVNRDWFEWAWSPRWAVKVYQNK